MLHLRSLTPLSSPCYTQWQLHAILRLPPELRQLALRQFSTSTPFTHAHSAQDDVDSAETHRVSRHLTPSSRAEERRRKKLQRYASQEQTANVRPREQQPSPMRVKTRINDGNGSIRVTAGRDWKDKRSAKVAALARPMKAKDPIDDPAAPADNWMNQSAVNATANKTNRGARLGRFVGSGSIPQRLAVLKEALLAGTDGVTDVSVIQQELRQLEHELRQLLRNTASFPQDASAAKRAEGRNTKQAKTQRQALRPDTSHLTGQGKGQSTQVVDSQERKPRFQAEDAHVIPNKFHIAHTSPDFVTDRGMHADTLGSKELKFQIQELTNLLKVLVSQQPTSSNALPASDVMSEVIQRTNDIVAAVAPGLAQGTAADTRNRRYQTAQKPQDRQATSIPFASLPHEIGFEMESAPSTTVDASSVPFTSSNLSTQVGETGNSLDKSPARSSVSKGAISPDTSLDELGSLYDLLFPEEAAAKSPPLLTAEMPVPRLPFSNDADAILNETNATRVSKSEQLARLYDSQQERSKTVLVLRSASKTLTEDDFRRAIPRGKHISEWTQKGEYERIIPVRDFWTLERTGDYYIVFKHSSAADAFLQHVKTVFNMTKEHTPSSLISPLRPAPKGLLSDGIDEEAESVRNFSLLAPSMSFSLERESKGVKSAVLAKGGYPQALFGSLTPDTPQVVLEMDGGNMPNWFQVRDAIARDGNRRGVPWSLMAGEFAIRRLVMKRPTRSQPELDVQWEAIEDEDSATEAFENHVGNDGDGDGDASMLARDRLRHGQNGQRWIVAFKERQEAQRFARTWHMRGFPWAEEDKKRDLVYKGATRVKAEVLWW